MQTIIPNTAEVYEIARQANAQHLIIVTDGVRTLLSPHVPPGWQKISAGVKQQPA